MTVMTHEFQLDLPEQTMALLFKAGQRYPSTVQWMCILAILGAQAPDDVIGIDDHHSGSLDPSDSAPHSLTPLVLETRVTSPRRDGLDSASCRPLTAAQWAIRNKNTTGSPDHGSVRPHGQASPVTSDLGKPFPGRASRDSANCPLVPTFRYQPPTNTTLPGVFGAGNQFNLTHPSLTRVWASAQTKHDDTTDPKATRVVRYFCKTRPPCQNRFTTRPDHTLGTDSHPWNRPTLNPILP
jgi:hypothetical protein